MMINWLLKNFGLNAEIDEVLYQKIHDNMMVRLQDKVAEIRAQAVTALQRLQVGIMTVKGVTVCKLCFYLCGHWLKPKRRANLTF